MTTTFQQKHLQNSCNAIATQVKYSEHFPPEAYAHLTTHALTTCWGECACVFFSSICPFLLQSCSVPWCSSHLASFSALGETPRAEQLDTPMQTQPLQVNLLPSPMYLSEKKNIQAQNISLELYLTGCVWKKQGCDNKVGSSQGERSCCVIVCSDSRM